MSMFRNVVAFLLPVLVGVLVLMGIFVGSILVLSHFSSSDKSHLFIVLNDTVPRADSIEVNAVRITGLDGEKAGRVADVIVRVDCARVARSAKNEDSTNDLFFRESCLLKDMAVAHPDTFIAGAKYYNLSIIFEDSRE